MDSPVGNVASILFSRRETVGWGSEVPTPMAEGLFDLTMICVLFWYFGIERTRGRGEEGRKERVTRVEDRMVFI